MLEMLEERKSSTVLDEKRDLMSNWIRASMAEERSLGKVSALSQQDILGNVFIFLIAGALLLVLVFSLYVLIDPSKKGTKLRRTL